MSENGRMIPVIKIEKESDLRYHENMSWISVNEFTLDERSADITFCCPVSCFIWAQSNQTSARTLREHIWL